MCLTLTSLIPSENKVCKLNVAGSRNSESQAYFHPIIHCSDERNCFVNQTRIHKNIDGIIYQLCTPNEMLCRDRILGDPMHPDCGNHHSSGMNACYIQYIIIFNQMSANAHRRRVRAKCMSSLHAVLKS